MAVDINDASSPLLVLCPYVWNASNGNALVGVKNVVEEELARLWKTQSST
jgi:hypothetical protein